MNRPRNWIGVLALALLAPGFVAAQERDANSDSLPPIPTELESLEGRPSPTGAMLRSFVLPGWGQASYDRYLRGGVYFTGHVGNTYMVLKTLARLDEAEDRAERWEVAARDSLVAAGVPADSIEIRVDEHAEVQRFRGLADARREQREDWVALGLFWILVSGVDAYVTAQLADFPASIGAATDGRRYGVYISVPVR